MANTVLGNLVWKITGDTSNFDKNLTKSETKLTRFGKKTTQIGKTLTKTLTLPIVGLGAAAVKAAADFEVIERKFQTAFIDAPKEAADSVKLLNEQFGLSVSQSKQLLANTGDLLKGFGATSRQAINTSTEVQKLASALSAYNGVPVAEASEKITKALLGETEGLKTLGVAIRQADVEKQLLANGTAELTGQELLLAKAQATLQLAVQQSGDAVASFAENQDTAAFQVQKLLGDLKDLGIQFGQIILPVIKDVVAQVSEWVKSFAELDDNTKATIVRIAAFAAAIGPVLVGVGKLVSALTALKGVLTILTGPVGLIVAAGVALTALTIKVATYKSDTEKLTIALYEEAEALQSVNVAQETQNTALQEYNALSVEQLKIERTKIELANTSAEAQRQALTKTAIQYTRLFDLYYEDLITLEELQSNQDILNFAREKGIDILTDDNLARNENLTLLDATLRKELEVINGLTVENETRLDIIDNLINEKSQQEALNAEKEKELAISAELQAVLDRRTESWNDYLKQVELAQERERLGIISNTSSLELQKNAVDNYISSLLESGFVGDATYQRFIDLSRSLQEQINAQTTAQETFVQELEEDTFTQIDLAELLDQSREVYFEKEKTRQQELLELRKRVADQSIQDALNLAGAINDIRQQDAKNEIAQIEAKKEQEVITEEDAAKKISRIKYQAALDAWNLKGLEIAVNKALAISQAVASAPFPFNLPAIGFATAETIAAAVLHSKSKPQLPAFEFGGVVPQSPGVPQSGDGQIIRVNPEEEVVRRDDPRHSYNGGGSNIIINTTLNTASETEMKRLARIIYPYMQQEGRRIG